MNDTKTKLLNKAAELLQTRGYNGFSFHDLADSVGIRTSSIHFHFPTKTNLGQTLINRYTNEFMTALGDPDAATPNDKLRLYVSLFHGSLSNNRMCLCGMVGAEISGLPKELNEDLQTFFDSNEVWLSKVYDRMGLTQIVATRRARLLLSTLEGAMIMSRVRNDIKYFEDISESIISLTMVV